MSNVVNLKDWKKDKTKEENPFKAIEEFNKQNQKRMEEERKKQNAELVRSNFANQKRW